MAGRGGEDEEPAGTKAVPFANDGSFLEQFLAMQKQEEASSSSAESKHEEPSESGAEQKKEQEAQKQDNSDKSANQQEKVAVKKVVAPPSLGKNLISSFSTKPKKAPEQAKAASYALETEDQTRKRKRDEYLAEMARFRSSSCSHTDSKHSLVK